MKKLIVLTIALLTLATQVHAAQWWLTSNRGHIFGPFSSFGDCNRQSIRMPYQSGVSWSCEIGY